MYNLGQKSRSRLQGVDPRLVRVVERAIAISSQDFSVHEGVRSVETQREYVRRGASQTMDSRHLLQPDGYGKAVDLVAWVHGSIRWEWPLYPPIADAMRRAAIEFKTPVRWGGGWFLLNDHASLASLKRATQAYVDARLNAKPKRKAFLDGPHFEIPKGA
jgi:peptidoglycan L-alanyl-D-glutamate endopeptidase CwlK